ncbi:Ribosome biogenesis protein RLP24 [Saccharomyces cerevisiae]|nr:Ribosome biogenesis protein RLP24 [Saccharomyces cerevisiae]
MSLLDTNRELVATTLKAMARIEEIRQKRERAFYKNRMRGNKEKDFLRDKKLVESNPELLRIREVEIARKLAKEQERAESVSEQEESEEGERIWKSTVMRKRKNNWKSKNSAKEQKKKYKENCFLVRTEPG